jgi:hypothetical protein
MKKMIRIAVMMGCVFGLTAALPAQRDPEGDLARADKQFDLYAYATALKSYESVLAYEPGNPRALAGLADCLVQMNASGKAIPWYSKAVAQPGASPELFGKYGKALMRQGDYKSAETQFERWTALNPTEAARYIEMCQYAQQTSGMEPMFMVRSLSINTAQSDFGAAIKGNRLVFSSARKDMPRKQVSKASSDWSGSTYNQLFQTGIQASTGNVDAPSFLRSDLQNVFNEGLASYAANGKTVAFCKNNFVDGNRQIASKGLNMSLFIADVVGDSWDNGRAFPYNGIDYSVGYPSLSADGQTLYFASNQPGGVGGWDIYVSKLSNGQWTQPRNLGPPLNTPGDELSPFFDGRDLFFASDYHRGYGGTDLFKGVLEGDEVTDIRHLGPGINSPADDYGLVFRDDRQVGYFTSNRSGGVGAEDIYLVTTKAFATPQASAPASRSVAPPAAAAEDYYLYVADDKGAPLEGVEVDVRDCVGEKGVTDAAGLYFLPPPSNIIDCVVRLRKSGYETRTIELVNFGYANAAASMTPDKRKDYRGVIQDAKSRKAIADAMVVLYDASTDTEAQAQTNTKGEYALYLAPNRDYEFSIGKKGYKTLKTTIKTDASGKIKPIGLEAGVDPPVPAPASVPAVAPPAVADAGIMGAGGYAIQVGILPGKPTDKDLSKFQALTQYGHIFTTQAGSTYKVKLGVYSSRNKAGSVLKEVRNMPQFKDAFIVEEKNVNSNLLLDEVDMPMAVTTPAAPAQLYAVEILRLPSSNPVVLDRYANISHMGSIYSKSVNNQTSIRLGVWDSGQEAAAVQRKVVDRGYTSALVVPESKEPGYLAMLNAGKGTPATQAKAAVNGAAYPMAGAAAEAPKYFVRLAALSQPERFDNKMLNGVGGTLQKQTLPNGMTLLYLSGFKSRKEAEAAADKAKANGIQDAMVAEMREGSLIRSKP